MYVQDGYQQREIWREKYPSVLGALLSVFQLIFTVVIVGCEVGGDFVQFPQMNAFVGYWTFLFFMCAWISLAGTSCCCRSRCCGIATIVFQCLAIPMALCVVGFDGYFLNNPTQCFFSSDCSSYYSSYGYSSFGFSVSNTTTLYSIKVPLIRGQLAAGVLMFVSCVIYVIIFVVTNYKVQQSNQLPNGHPAPVTIISQPAQYTPQFMNSTYENPAMQPPVRSTVAASSYKSTVEPPTTSTTPGNQITCPNCRSEFQICT